MRYILEAKDISKSYVTKAGKVSVIREISVGFEKGKFYAIIGRSGSGKSTLLHLLSGLDKVDSGRVRLNDTELSECTDSEMAKLRRTQMGFIFQQYNLLEEYDVKSNICMPLKLEHKKIDETYFRSIVEKLGLTKLLKKYPTELSGGEQQRVAIARSLIARPEIVFADEPTGNLDKYTSDQTLDMMLACAKEYKQTLIMVTHDMEIAKRADQVFLMEDGTLTQQH